MRISPARCALVVLSLVIAAGCSSSGSKPGMSLSKLNPFSSSETTPAPPFVEKPSSLASPTSTVPSESEYAAAASRTGEGSSYASAATGNDASSGRYPSTRYAYPSTRADSAPCTSPATPQQGYYGANADYGTPGGSAQAISPSRPSSGTNSNAYDWLNGSNSGVADRDYSAAAASGRYGGSTAASARYSTASDRYGLGRTESNQAADSSYGQGAGSDPYASVRDHNSSRYPASQESFDPASGGANDAGSRYRTTPLYTASSSDRYGSTGGEPASSGSRSLVGDRYASAATSAGGASDDSNSRGYGENAWNPGETGYRPGGPTEYMPGRSDYEPGNTGYNPPGVSPYRSPASSYEPPGGMADATVPFLPGSTRRLELPSTPGESSSSDSTDRSPSDSRVISSSYAPYSSTTR